LVHALVAAPNPDTSTQPSAVATDARVSYGLVDWKAMALVRRQ
jgi:hypothetical protein